MTPDETPLPGDLAVVPLEAPPGWRGEALAAWRTFAFHALPWERVARTGDRADGAECVKASRSRRALRLEAAPPDASGPPLTVYAKRYRINTARRRLGNLFIGGKAQREFRLGHELRRAGVATPLPLAWARCRRPFAAPGDPAQTLPPAGYLLTREWANEGALPAWIAAHGASQPGLWTLVARFLARAHGLGFYHDDCAAEHLLVAPGLDPADPPPLDAPPDAAPLAFIDIDNGRLGKGPIELHERWTNLAQLLKSLGFKKLPADRREAFLTEYLRAASLERAISLDSARHAVDRIARRKVGRGVFQPQ